MTLPRLLVSIPDASPDGNFYGRYPAGNAPVGASFPNSAPAFLPMRQLYPAPTGVGSNEPHQFAFFDPVANSAHGFMWQKRVGASFGRWPLTYKLVSGPPGMAFGATTWNPAWDGKGDLAYREGYGVLRWTPTAAISPSSPTTVSVDIGDQDGNVLNLSWPIYTAGDITQPGGLFAFLDADDTSGDSSGTGGFANPWQTMVHALGTSASSSGAAPPGCALVPMQATNAYIFPQTSTNVFSWNAAHKPASIIGIPGSAPTIDFSAGAGVLGTTGVGIVPASAGLLMQDVILENYTNINDFRAFTWNSLNRLIFQGLIWNNAGYGASSNNNASMFYPQGGSPSFGKYCFITGCQENNRQSSSQANNCAFIEAYSNQEMLIELNLANSPDSQVGEAFYMKSDIGLTCVRENAGFFASCGHGFDFGQAPYQGSFSSEISYNVGVGIGNVNVPEIVGYSWGNLAVRRNNIVSSGLGLLNQSPSFNMMAPYTGSNTAPFDIATLVAAISTSPTGGYLSAGTRYYAVTTIGVTGESSIQSSNGTSEMWITSTGSTSVNTVPWLDVLGENGFKVYFGTAPPPPGTPAGTIVASGGTLPAGTYHVVIKAIDAEGNASAISAASAGEAVTIADSSIEYSWAASATAVSYQIWYSLPGSTAYDAYYTSITNSFTLAATSGTSATLSAQSRCENQYVEVAPGVTSLTDNGALSWTAGTPPASSTAVSANKFNFDSNLIQNPTQSAVPGGATSAADTGNVFSVNMPDGELLDLTTGLVLTSNGGNAGVNLI